MKMLLFYTICLALSVGLGTQIVSTQTAILIVSAVGLIALGAELDNQDPPGLG